MSRTSLAGEIVEVLRETGPATAAVVAMQVRARREDVEEVLRGDGFRVVPRPKEAHPRSVFFDVSPAVPDRRRPSQCDRVLAVLRDGRPHTMTEIHQFAGFMRLNSRVADLRKRGHKIKCHRRDGDYVYQLLRCDTLDEPTPAVGAGRVGSSSVPPETEPSETLPLVEHDGTLFPPPHRGAYSDEAA